MLLCNLHRPAALRVAARRGPPLPAAAAGASGINDDNRERVVKGEVGDPSKAQVQWPGQLAAFSLANLFYTVTHVVLGSGFCALGLH